MRGTTIVLSYLFSHTIRFSSGVSSLKSITAAEFVPLCWQMIAVLGVSREGEQKGGLILPYLHKLDVVKVFFDLMTIREELWKERHLESELDALQDRIRM